MKCRTCQHWSQVAYESEDKGWCEYEPPPVVRHIYTLAQAEPTTQINWQSQIGGPFVTDAAFWCSEHKPKPSTI